MTDRIQDFCGDHWWKVAGAGVGGSFIAYALKSGAHAQNLNELNELLQKAENTGESLKKLYALQGDFLQHNETTENFFIKMHDAISTNSLLTNLKTLGRKMDLTGDIPANLWGKIEDGATNASHMPDRASLEAGLTENIRKQETNFKNIITNIRELFSMHFLEIENGIIKEIKPWRENGGFFRVEFVRKIAKIVGVHHVAQGGPELNLYNLMGWEQNGWERRVEKIKAFIEIARQESVFIKVRSNYILMASAGVAILGGLMGWYANSSKPTAK